MKETTLPNPTEEKPHAQQFDPAKLEALAGHVLTEIGAAANASLVQSGYELGLFDKLSENGPMTAGELAASISGNERHLREWLSSQYTSGMIDYDDTTDKFSLTPEQEMVLVNRDSPVYLGGSWYGVASMYHGIDAITRSMQTGEGVAWGDQCSCLFCSTAEFYRPAYQNALLSEWIPALEGVHLKLESGANTLDIGCGYGHSTAILAGAFPKSRFTGLDLHESSIEEARKIAVEAGASNAYFEAGDARTFTGNRYDLVTMFDAFHDMGNPVEIARHIREELLVEGGTLMIVEPRAGDTLSENKNPMGRAFYAFSTAFCTANALSQLNDDTRATAHNALGAQAGEARLSSVLREAGFSQIRRAADSIELMVLVAKA